MTIGEFVNKCQATWGRFEGDPAVVASVWRDALADVRPDKLDAAFRYLAQESKYRPKPADVFNALAKLGNAVSVNVTPPPGWEPVLDAMGEPFWQSYLANAELVLDDVAEIIHPLAFTADVLKSRYAGEISRALGKTVYVRSANEKRQDDRAAKDRAAFRHWQRDNPNGTVWEWLGVSKPKPFIPKKMTQKHSTYAPSGSVSAELKAKLDPIDELLEAQE